MRQKVEIQLYHIYDAEYFISLRKKYSTKMHKPMNRIKEVLEEKDIKQTWLAERLGKSFSIVNAYVCNRRQPSLELLFEMAKLLQVDPKELIATNHNGQENK